MTLIDIKKAVITKLKPLKHMIYATKIKEGLKKPCFFINVMPIMTQNNLYFKKKDIMVKIYFFADDSSRPDATYLDNMQMQDTLSNMFSKKLRIGNRDIFIANTEGHVAAESRDDMAAEDDTVLTFGFELEFEDGNEAVMVGDDFMFEDEELGYTEGNIELMQELNLTELEE